MKRISITIALVISMLIYLTSENDTDVLVLENVEALSQGDTKPNVKKVSDISENFDVETVKVPESYDDEGNVIEWKDVVVRVVHRVTCASTEGLLMCKARKDYHSKDAPEMCPNAN